MKLVLGALYGRHAESALVLTEGVPGQHRYLGGPLQPSSGKHGFCARLLPSGHAVLSWL